MARFPNRQIVNPATGEIVDPRNPRWRRKLRIASFKGAPFYVDQQGRSSGRRTVLHQYPKRDIPYAEDMGREAMRYQITGYLIMAPNWTVAEFYPNKPSSSMYSNYDDARDLLERQLVSKSPGRLLDPYNPNLALVGYGMGTGPLLFMCERYTIVEQREKGGYCSLEMSFVEAGIPGNQIQFQNTAAAVSNAADAASAATAAQVNQQQTEINQVGVDLLREPGVSL
jgi:DNA circularisation protein